MNNYQISDQVVQLREYFNCTTNFLSEKFRVLIRPRNAVPCVHAYRTVAGPAGSEAR